MYNAVVIQFLKNGATGHWIKSSSIFPRIRKGQTFRNLYSLRIPSGVYLSVFWEQTMDN